MTVANSVVLDTDVHVAGVVIEPGATLSFDPGKTITLESTGNVVVRGTLAMRPDASARHRLVLTDVDEAAFVGSGMSVIAADVGVWVMGQGRLDVMGVPKTAWARLAGDGGTGDVVVQLDRVVSGWEVGDRAAVAPTAPFSVRRDLVSWRAFSEARSRTCTTVAKAPGGPSSKAWRVVDGGSHNGTIDQAGRGKFGIANDRHFASPSAVTTFESCSLLGHTVAALGLIVPNRSAPELIDLLSCSFQGNELWMASNVHPDSVVRFDDRAHGTIAVRPAGQPRVFVPAWNARMQPIDVSA